ncbi:MAG TPA: gamma-glutamyl-gamma-aminobutyrate hydrolase family protein, partial [Alphaproteobacteria bacterium]|nr:gamma-glutamyl-gamma-aminobutyrate hydrolase family protein [Alphaproteobacteria bacterium]
PLVGIPCCTKPIGPHPFHIVGDKYIRAVSEGAGALPFLIPALGDWYDLDDLIGRLDGLLVTGSPSNVEPRHYGGEAVDPAPAADPARDATTLPLIRKALAVGVPVLAICRGLQELNVALGGTLSQEVHRIPGRLDHRADESRPVEEQYGPVHPVAVEAGGALHRLFGKAEIRVNSIHAQGIDRLADGVTVEATAPDGQIEAVRVDRTPEGLCPDFALAVQWHPEWRFRENRESTVLFEAFGAAIRTYAGRRSARAAE